MTSTAMLASDSTNVAITATPGTCPGSPGSPGSTSRIASKVWTNVATNKPMAKLAGPIAEQPLRNARRELTHGSLHNHQHNRQDQGDQADHRGGDGAQDGRRRVR